MKRLICAKEIEAMAELGESVLWIDSQTIVTPSAQDAIKLYGIKVENGCCEKKEKVDQLDRGLVYQVLKAMMDRQMLDQFLNEIGRPLYESEQSDSGFFMVHGDSVRYQKESSLHRCLGKDSEGRQNEAHGPEICEIDSPFIKHGQCSYLRMENKSYQRYAQSDALCLVLEGEMDMIFEKKSYSIKSGDMIRIPKGSDYSFIVHKEAKLFCFSLSTN